MKNMNYWYAQTMCVGAFFYNVALPLTSATLLFAEGVKIIKIIKIIKKKHSTPPGPGLV